MFPRICIALLLGGLAAFVSACSNAGNRTALPSFSAQESSASAAHALRGVKIREFPDLLQTSSSGYFPLGIASGPDNSLWVIDDIDLDFGQGAVIKIATTGKLRHAYYYPGTSSGAAFVDITVGPDGALWMTDDNNEQIIRLTTKGVYSKFPLDVSPISIATGPDKAIWFTGQSLTGVGYEVGRLTTKGHVTIYSLSQQTWDIAAGPDGALWFTEIYGPPGIGRITTSGKITEYTRGITGVPDAIAAGPDGAVWFTEDASGGGRIGRITTSGSVTEYSQGISPMENPNGIAPGPDGAMWFTETLLPYAAAKIGRISMQGKINEYSRGLNPQSGPSDITAGPDGRMWFVETKTDETGRLTI